MRSVHPHVPARAFQRDAVIASIPHSGVWLPCASDSPGRRRACNGRKADTPSHSPVMQSDRYANRKLQENICNGARDKCGRRLKDLQLLNGEDVFLLDKHVASVRPR